MRLATPQHTLIASCQTWTCNLFQPLKVASSHDRKPHPIRLCLFLPLQEPAVIPWNATLQSVFQVKIVHSRLLLRYPVG